MSFSGSESPDREEFSVATDRDSVRSSLEGIDFPAGKSKLVDFAAERGADEATVRALRSMAPETYENMTEVMRSVPLDKASEEGQTDAHKAEQDTGNAADALAEHQRRTSDHPIVEELGENRGS